MGIARRVFHRSAMDQDIRVSSWSELHDRLYESSWREPLGRFRSNFAFRGVSQADYNLKSSLSRMGSVGDLERHILRNFRKYRAEQGRSAGFRLELARRRSASRTPDTLARLDLLALRGTPLRDRAGGAATIAMPPSGAWTTA